MKKIEKSEIIFSIMKSNHIKLVNNHIGILIIDSPIALDRYITVYVYTNIIYVCEHLTL